MAIFNAVVSSLDLLDQQQNKLSKNLQYNVATRRRQQIIQAMQDILISSAQSDGIYLDIDYSQEDYRAAYCLLFLTSHVHMVKEILAIASKSRDADFNNWLKDVDIRGRCNLSCVGGGPGTDVIAFMMFMKDVCPDVVVDSVILDKYISWEYNFSQIQAKLKHLLPPHKCRITYNKMDLLGELDWAATQALQSSDIIMFVKSLSAVNFGSNAQNQINNLLQHLKPGALVLFIDNGLGKHIKIMTKTASLAGFKLCLQRINDQVELNEDERRAIGNYMQMGDNNMRIVPQCGSIVSTFLWQKPTLNQFFSPPELQTVINAAPITQLQLQSVPPAKITPTDFDQVKSEPPAPITTQPKTNSGECVQPEETESCCYNFMTNVVGWLCCLFS